MLSKCFTGTSHMVPIEMNTERMVLAKKSD
jgi:hypothetical protein